MGCGLQPFDKTCRRDAGAQLEVDAAQEAHLVEKVLCRAHIHHRQGGTAGTHLTDHTHRFQCQGDLQLRPCTQTLLGSRVQKEGVRGEEGQALAVLVGLRHQRGRHLRHTQGVNTEHPQGHGDAVAVCHLGGHFKHGGGRQNIRVLCHAGIQGLVKNTLRTAQLQIRLAVDRARGLRKLVQSRLVDQMHRKRQRHAQHHRHHRRRIAPRVVS